METPHSTPLKVLLVASAFCASLTSAQGQVAYDNSENLLDLFVAQPFQEYGDEINTAPGSGDAISAFQFDYFGRGLEGDETAVLRFYLNDGDPTVPGANSAAPGTLLYESDSFTLADGQNFISADLAGLGILCPDTLTWTVEFDLGDDDVAGLVLADPPTVGSSFDDFWVKDGDAWTLFRYPDGVPAGNFSAKLWCVPEGDGVMTIAGVGAIAGMALFRRFRKAAK